MDMELFRRIIDQIDPASDCRIIPYLNGEPLLDSLIIDRLRYINAKLPNGEVELSTNVSTLTAARQGAMVGIHLNDLRLSVFGFTENTHKKIMPGLKWSMVKQNLDHLVTNSLFRKSIDRISLIMIEHPLVTDEDIRIAREYCE